jgi:hypothetical protein
MTYKIVVHHDGVDKTGRPLAAGDVNCVGGDEVRVFYNREEAESLFENLWDTFRSGHPRADRSAMNFTKVSLYRYDGMNAEKNPEYTLIRFAQSQENISVEV